MHILHRYVQIEIRLDTARKITSPVSGEMDMRTHWAGNRRQGYREEDMCVLQ